MNILIRFIILFLAGFSTFLLAIVFLAPHLLDDSVILAAFYSFPVAFFLVASGVLNRYPNIYLIIFLVFLGETVFSWGAISGYLQYVYEILLVSYLFTLIVLIWKGLLRKYLVIPILILTAEFLICCNIIPSQYCSYNFKIQMYECDCQGVRLYYLGGSRCIGERTNCYKFLHPSGEKIKIDCSEMDKKLEH